MATTCSDGLIKYDNAGSIETEITIIIIRLKIITSVIVCTQKDLQHIIIIHMILISITTIPELEITVFFY